MSARTALSSLQGWWLDRSVRAKGFIVIAVPLVTLIGVTSAGLTLQYNEHQERAAGRSASVLQKTADQILTDLVNAETGVRGYAATRDERFLSPYHATLERFGADQAAFQDAAASSGETSQQLTISASATRALSELKRLRTVIGAGISAQDLTAALARQKTALDPLRREIAALDQRLTTSLAGRRDAITQVESVIIVSNLVGLALGLLTGLAGIVLFTSGVSDRVRANAVNADRLGAGLPLAPVRRSRDEIGRVAEALVQAEKLLASRAAELTAARDQALQATRAKNAFLSHTSHELRTPLNSILGFTQLLEMADLSAEDHDSAHRILAAGRHLLALINELIDISRIESGDLSLSLEPVSIRPLIEEASQLTAPLAAERSITLVPQCTPTALAVRADRHRLTQILVNLISNAIKYNRRGGTITIICQQDGTERASLIVSDTGRGIPPEDLDRIFVPFERLGAEQSGIEGTGIGLPLARALAEAMDGTLSASSVLGEGSAFTLTLPRAPDVTQSPHRETSPERPAAWHGSIGASLNILYIEDNPANVEVISRFLKARPNTTLRSAGSGREGVESAVRDVPDIILLDLHLPDLPGEQVLNEIKSEPATATVPVVVLSADASPRVIRRLRTRGATAYLTKPVNLIELGELLDSITAPAVDQQTHPTASATP